jgi:arsenate reductase (glutaredoxin)
MQIDIETTGVVVYGIPNCDTVKKARQFLNSQSIEYTFWNYAVKGVPTAVLDTCLAQYGWQTICNTKGLTWRKLPELTKNQVCDASSAITVLQQYPSAIKRPIVFWGTQYNQRITVGFDALVWANIINVKVD